MISCGSFRCFYSCTNTQTYYLVVTAASIQSKTVIYINYLLIFYAIFCCKYSDWTVGWTTAVRFPSGEVGTSSLLHRVQTGSGAHSVSYPMDTGGSFIGGKVAGE
jgi:hypothetical protein